MKLDLRSRGLSLPPDMREFVDRRLRYALGRFADRVRAVQVRLEDVNGPRGGRDIQCKVEARLHPRGSVLVAETRRDPFVAVAHAAGRVSHAVSRRLTRKRGRPAGARA